VKPIAVQDLAAADARLKAAQQPWLDGLSATRWPIDEGGLTVA
jgi:hypothetical protein